MIYQFKKFSIGIDFFPKNHTLVGINFQQPEQITFKGEKSYSHTMTVLELGLLFFVVTLIID